MEPIRPETIDGPGTWTALAAGATRWLAVAVAGSAAFAAVEGAGVERELAELWFEISWQVLGLALGACALTWLGVHLGDKPWRWARWPFAASVVALIAAFSPPIAGLILGALVVSFCLYALWDEYIA
jgi:hypothetical protein